MLLSSKASTTASSASSSVDSDEQTSMGIRVGAVKTELAVSSGRTFEAASCSSWTITETGRSSVESTTWRESTKETSLVAWKSTVSALRRGRSCTGGDCSCEAATNLVSDAFRDRKDGFDIQSVFRRVSLMVSEEGGAVSDCCIFAGLTL
jgi:hypothetical protein